MQQKLCISVPCSVHLDVAAEREVFPHGVALEAIVSQYAAEVRVVREEHSVHIPHLQQGEQIATLTLLY